MYQKPIKRVIRRPVGKVNQVVPTFTPDNVPFTPYKVIRRQGQPISQGTPSRMFLTRKAFLADGSIGKAKEPVSKASFAPVGQRTWRNNELPKLT